MNNPNQNEDKRAVIYCRVSTMEQVEEGNSLNWQEKECRKYAQKHGYIISEDESVFIERGESAKTANRTELQKLLRYCAGKKNKVAAVIVYKLDRLARNTDDYSQLRLLLRRYNVSIKSATEPIEDTPIGRFMENTISNVAEFDNAIRAERSTGGMKDAVREGRYVWQAPVGLVNGVVAGKADILVGEMALLVRRTFELIATGLHATDEVRRMMTKEGLCTKSGKAISKSYFYAMLRNELYAGWIIKFGERHRANYGQIVKDELFSKVQRVLKNKGHIVAEYKTDNPDFPLRRFVFSPIGLKLTGSWSRGNGGKYPFYRFGSKGSNYQRDEVEKEFAGFMDGYRFELAHIEKLKRCVREKFYEATRNERTDIQKQEKRLVELDTRQTTLVEKNMKGILSDDLLKRQLRLVEIEIEETQIALASQPRMNVSPDEAVAFSESYLTAPSTVWKKVGFRTKTRLQKFQFPAGVVFDGQKFGTTEISCVFKAKEMILSPLSSTVDTPGKTLNRVKSYLTRFWDFYQSTPQLQEILVAA